MEDPSFGKRNEHGETDYYHEDLEPDASIVHGGVRFRIPEGACRRNYNGFFFRLADSEHDRFVRSGWTGDPTVDLGAPVERFPLKAIMVIVAPGWAPSNETGPLAWKVTAPRPWWFVRFSKSPSDFYELPAELCKRVIAHLEGKSAIETALLGPLRPPLNGPMYEVFNPHVLGFEQLSDTPSSRKRVRELAPPECSICSSECDHAFVPCGHLCVCAPCAVKMYERSGRSDEQHGLLCPVCRGQAIGIYRVYQTSVGQ